MTRYKILAALFLLTAPATAHLKEIQPRYEIKKDTIDERLNGKFRLTIEAKSSEGYVIEIMDIYLDGKSVATAYGNTYTGTFEAGKRHEITIRNPEHYTLVLPKIEFIKNRDLTVKVSLYTEREFPITVEKPVIYLYPEERELVDVHLDFKGRLGFTYPVYDKGWKVWASPNGDLDMDDRYYKYLFYDGEIENIHNLVDRRYGFIVEGKKADVFLESLSDKIGLNASERNDFVTYWAPRMISMDQVYVYCITGQAYSEICDLTISPEPDSMLRFYLVFADVSGYRFDEFGLVPQTFEAFNRKGFSVVEWGGSEVSYNDIITAP